MSNQVIEKRTFSPAGERKTFGASIAKFRELGLLTFIIVLSIIVQLNNNSFLTLENINDLITNTAILSILSVGMMLVIITRGIDLSIGATLALSGMISCHDGQCLPRLTSARCYAAGYIGWSD